MPWEAFQKRLVEIENAGLRRELKAVAGPQGRWIRHANRDYLNFSSNNYLGLAEDPRLREAMIRGVRDYGVGAGSARLVNGSLQPCHDLEEALADFKGTEAALLFNSGYQANVGLLSCLLPPEGIFFSDQLNHASIIDGLRLSKARKILYPHGNLEALREKVREHRRLNAKTPMAVVTETVFSMDGDLAPLGGLLDLAEEEGLLLYVDEAHATGVLGENGAGYSADFRRHPAFQSRLVQMGTLGKALGCFGAYVAGPKVLMDYFMHAARTFVFTTALPPGVACAALAALKIVREEPEVRKELWQRLAFFSEQIGRPVTSPIIPWIVGSEEETLKLSASLGKAGFWVTAIRPPTVPPGTSRLRMTVMATHTEEDIQSLIKVLEKNG